MITIANINIPWWGALCLWLLAMTIGCIVALVLDYYTHGDWDIPYWDDLEDDDTSD